MTGSRSEEVDVAIVGAGPTGMMLAAELTLRGVSCAIFDKRSSRSPHSRAFGLQPRCLEILDCRGQLENVLAAGVRSPVISLGSEDRGIDMTGRTDSRFEYMLIIPQLETEEILEKWLDELGCTIRRNEELSSLKQSGTQVQLDFAGESSTACTAKYVVGCDGANSAVRRLSRIGFPGTPYDFSAIIADVELAQPPEEQVFARHSSHGMVAVMPFADGSYRLMIQDHARMQVPVAVPVTIDEIRDSALQILGVDLGIHSPRWLSRFRSEQRLADLYRKNRVLLAGDAAHVHSPAGGQGMNLGLQDALNLGWKLTAALRATSERADLLDTYESELRPIARRTLRETDAVFRFNTAQGWLARGARAVSKELLFLPFLQEQVVQQIAGTQSKYRMEHRGGELKVVGRRAPDAYVRSGGGVDRIFGLLRSGDGLLLDSTPGGLYAAHVAGLHYAMIQTCAVDGPVPPLGAVTIIRPDGYVVYASDRPQMASVLDVLSFWFAVTGAT